MFGMWPDVAWFVYAGEMYSEMYRSGGYKYSRTGCSIDADPPLRAESEEKKERKSIMVESG